MKVFYSVVLLGALALSACSKNSRDCGNEPARTPQTVAAPAPTVTFQINNLVNGGNILEGRTVDLGITAQNAVSYNWDFGDGFTSTEQNPQHHYTVCSTRKTITVKVTNRDGLSTTFSQEFVIQCSRGYNGNATPDDHPVH